MKPDIKKRWVEALRSGEYKQGRSALSHNGKFCCLGVLCELAVKDKIAEKYDRERFDCFSYGLAGDSSPHYLPKCIRVWAGINTHDWAGEYKDKEGKNETLANKNDAGSTFEEIANLIEENF